MRVLPDTSAWVEFLRGTGSPVNLELRDGLQRERLVTTSPVVMEVLAGARTAVDEQRLAALLGTAPLLSCERADYVEAARIYRSCRANGEPVRSLMDCLISAVAIREHVPILHADRDFDAIARATPLQVVIS